MVLKRLNIGKKNRKLFNNKMINNFSMCIYIYVFFFLVGHDEMDLLRVLNFFLKGYFESLIDFFFPPYCIFSLYDFRSTILEYQNNPGAFDNRLSVGVCKV